MKLPHPQQRPKVGCEAIKNKIKNTRMYPEPCQSTKMERFAKIVH